MSAVAPSEVHVRPPASPTADSTPATAPEQRVQRADRPPPPGVVPPDPDPAPSDDSSRLMALLAVFVVAPLVVVAGVWAVAAIDTVWALVLALGVYFLTTFFVCATVASVLSAPVPPAPPHRHAG